jgi:hypothetical protein
VCLQWESSEDSPQQFVLDWDWNGALRVAAVSWGECQPLIYHLGAMAVCSPFPP